MVPTDGSELKRRKKVATDEICVVKTLDSDFTPNPKPLALHGSPVESNMDVQWATCDSILPYIANHTIPMELANPLDWSFDMYLIEVGNVHTDVVCSNVELNGTVLKAKQDTGAQINVLSKVVFQTLQKECKLPFYPKTSTKLVRYRDKVMNYLGTTKIKCKHNDVETEAVFYVTDIQDSKIILRL